MNDKHGDIKFRWKNEVKYGQVDNYSTEAKKARQQGLFLVEDAITPQRYLVREEEIVKDIPFGDYKTNEYYKHLESELKKAQAISKKVKGIGVGKLFASPVADGCAWYVITKVNKATVKIEWRGFEPDRYIDRHFGYEGTYPRSMIKNFVGISDLPDFGAEW